MLPVVIALGAAAFLTGCFSEDEGPSVDPERKPQPQPPEQTGSGTRPRAPAKDVFERECVQYAGMKTFRESAGNPVLYNESPISSVYGAVITKSQDQRWLADSSFQDRGAQFVADCMSKANKTAAETCDPDVAGTNFDACLEDVRVDAWHGCVSSEQATPFMLEPGSAVERSFRVNSAGFPVAEQVIIYTTDPDKLVIDEATGATSRTLAQEYVHRLSVDLPVERLQVCTSTRAGIAEKAVTADDTLSVGMYY